MADSRPTGAFGEGGAVVPILRTVRAVDLCSIMQGGRCSISRPLQRLPIATEYGLLAVVLSTLGAVSGNEAHFFRLQHQRSLQVERGANAPSS